MSYLVPQLDGSPHAGDNCGPASVAEALRWATDHDIAPSPSRIRGLMGDFSGGTQMCDHKIAWDKFIPVAAEAGWRLEPMHDRGISPFTDLNAAIAKGRAATVAISYADLDASYRCSRSFLGLHAIFISRRKVVGKTTMYKVWDPLADGRYHGIPRGPIWYPADVLMRACAGATGRRATAWFNIVRRATLIDMEPVIPQGDTEPNVGVIKER